MPNNTCEHCGGSQLIGGLTVSASGGGGDVSAGPRPPAARPEDGRVMTPARGNPRRARGENTLVRSEEQSRRKMKAGAQPRNMGF